LKNILAIEKYCLKKLENIMNTATQTIDLIYESLANRFYEMDYKTYSTNYLGRNNSYYSYLKSSSSSVSIEALFNLYAKLMYEEEMAKEKILEADDRDLQRICQSRAEYFGDMKHTALNGLLETAYDRLEEQKESKC
jgi:hypothetical protein